MTSLVLHELRREKEARTDGDKSMERKLFDMSRELLCVSHPDGNFVRVNPAFERALVWTTAELEGRQFLDFIHEDDVQATIEEFASILNGTSTDVFVNRYRRKDGRYVVLDWSAEPPETDTGLVYASALVKGEPEG